MTLTSKVSPASFLLSFALLCGTALGCQCVDHLRTPYQEFDDAAIVFTGRVVRHRDKVIDEPNNVIERTFIFMVEEAFKNANSKEIEINVGFTNSICYQGFHPKPLHLVYARKNSVGEFWTAMCSRTFVAGPSDAYYLQRKLRGEKEAKLYGSVSGIDRLSRDELKRSSIVAEQVGGRKFTSPIDKSGRFSFSDLPNGEYNIALVTPVAKSELGEGYRILLGDSESIGTAGGIRKSAYLSFAIDRKLTNF